MEEVNGVRSEPFTLTRSIRQGCPQSPMRYILALEPFLRKLKANLVIRGLTLPGSREVVRYTAYADDVSVLVKSSVEVEEVSKEIGRYEHTQQQNPFAYNSLETNYEFKHGEKRKKKTLRS